MARRDAAAWNRRGCRLGGSATTGAPAAKPAYTLAEYNAYTAAHNEQNVAQRMKLLDDFVMKYPMSALLPFVYRDYYLGYYVSKNYPQAIDYADKELALGDKVDIGTRLEAYIVWAHGLFHRPVGQGLADSRDAHQDQGRRNGRFEDPGCLAEARQDDRRRSSRNRRPVPPFCSTPSPAWPNPA